jgi:hypothetical protein
MVGVVRFAKSASFFLRAARRPRMLETTIENVSDQRSYANTEVKTHT